MRPNLWKIRNTSWPAQSGRKPDWFHPALPWYQPEKRPTQSGRGGVINYHTVLKKNLCTTGSPYYYVFKFHIDIICSF